MTGMAQAIAHFFGQVIPWWVWAVLGLGAVAAVARLAGIRAAMAAAAALALALAHRRGAQQGYRQARQEGDREADRIVETARDERARADRRGRQPSGLRDDDGFRRD